MRSTKPTKNLDIEDALFIDYFEAGNKAYPEVIEQIFRIR